MARYTLYRHPHRGDVAVRDGGLFSGGRSDRLIREGYRDAGLIEADSEREALTKAQGRQPTAGQTAGQRAPQSAARSQAPPPTRQGTAQEHRPSGPPPAAMLRAGAAFFWFAIGIGVFIYMMRSPSLPEPGSGDFSRWMDYAEIERFQSQLDSEHYRVVEVEGRWSNGEPECRVRTGAAPQHAPHRWFWWCGRPREEFVIIDRDARQQGFDRVSLHSFADGDDRIRHSGVWHRVQGDNLPPRRDLTPQAPGT